MRNKADMFGSLCLGESSVVDDELDRSDIGSTGTQEQLRRQCASLPTSIGRRVLGSVLLSLVVLCQQAPLARADDEDDYIFSASAKRDWLYGGGSIGIQVTGCVWGYIEGGEDGAEDMACRENESEDGTTYWYQMANCRRAQVAYDVFASDSKSVSCSASNFKESLMTKNGLAEFIYTVNAYGQNSPFGNVDYEDLPMCEEDGNGYYLSVGCTASGTFAINRFSDAYCMVYEDTYATLDDVNYAIQNMQSCNTCYDASSGNSAYQSMCAYLVPYCESCTSLDTPLCTDTDYFESTTSGRSRRRSHSGRHALGATWVNKIKYVLGSLLLVASVTMFMGILFTNRRRRRAMMHRRFRQSASRSKSRSSRSKSRNRSSSRARRKKSSGEGGVFT